MSAVVVGKVSSFTDPGRRVVSLDGVEIGIFLHQGRFTAFENVCPHLAGPACQGKMLPLTLEALNADATSRGREFSKDRMNVVCPWHGFEFDIRTGEHPTNPRMRLRPVEVSVEGDDVVVVPPRRMAARIAAERLTGEGGEDRPAV